MNSAERVTEIVALLRPERPRRLPESLTSAAIAGDLVRMQLFLDRGAKMEERSIGFASPLSAACGHGQIEAARWLIARGALMDVPGVTNGPIHSALVKANCEAAAVLLDAGLPIECALWGVIAAAALGRLDMLRWLVGRGIDLDQRYPDFGVPRERALANVKKEGADELVRFLKGESDPGPPPVAPPPAPPLCHAAPRAMPEDHSRLIAEAVAVIRGGGTAAARWNAAGPAAPPLRQSLLAFAAGTGLSEIVAALLDAGASPNFAHDGTPPPLYRAAEEAQMETAAVLLARGALPDGKDGKSWLPLAGAALSGEIEMVRMLLVAGAKAKVRPAGGRTVAEHARGPFAPEIRALLEPVKHAKSAVKSKHPSEPFPSKTIV